MIQRGRNWFLTINYKENDPLDDNFLLDYIKSESVKFTAFQLERGEEEGVLHHQVLICFKNARTFESVKNLFPNAHIEKVLGTLEQALEYVTKEETRVNDPLSYGELPEKGKRNDLAQIIEMINNGSKLSEIRETFPGQYLRYIKGIKSIYQEIKFEKFRNEFRKLHVCYIYGDTGIGKSRYVLDKYKFENVYRVTNYQNPFDSYSGEDVLAFEEFRQDISINQLLQYLDGYPLKLPARYEDKTACYTKVYFISNWPFEKQYKDLQATDSKTYQALCRRITLIGSLEEIKEKDIKTEIDNNKESEIIL